MSELGGRGLLMVTKVIVFIMFQHKLESATKLQSVCKQILKMGEREESISYC